METLFESKEQYLAMREAWSKFCNQEEKQHIEPYQLAIYAILRKKDWRKSFSEHSAEETISNIEWYIRSSSYVNLIPFGDSVTMDHIKRMRDLDIPGWEW